jgi:hypothetical protein
MTSLLIFTFFLGGTHTILWLPRALKWRKELKRLEAEEEAGRHQERTIDTLVPPEETQGPPDDDPDNSNDKEEVV